MKATHVFNYSQVIKTEIAKSIKEFAKQTLVDFPSLAILAVTEEKEGGVIFNYKIGEINTEQFRKALNKLITDKGGIPLADNNFDDYWNSMCSVEPEKLVKLYELQQKKEFGLHIIGHTNPLQHEFIQQEIKKAPHAPEISYTLSFEKHTLDKESLKEYAGAYIASLGSMLVWQNDSPVDVLEVLGEYYNSGD